MHVVHFDGAVEVVSDHHGVGDGTVSAAPRMPTGTNVPMAAANSPAGRSRPSPVRPSGHAGLRERGTNLSVVVVQAGRTVCAVPHPGLVRYLRCARVRAVHRLGRLSCQECRSFDETRTVRACTKLRSRCWAFCTMLRGPRPICAPSLRGVQHEQPGRGDRVALLFPIARARERTWGPRLSASRLVF